jgi:hypothetical protein
MIATTCQIPPTPEQSERTRIRFRIRIDSDRITVYNRETQSMVITAPNNGENLSRAIAELKALNTPRQAPTDSMGNPLEVGTRVKRGHRQFREGTIIEVVRFDDTKNAYIMRVDWDAGPERSAFHPDRWLIRSDWVELQRTG